MALSEYRVQGGVVLVVKLTVGGVLTAPTTGAVRVRKPSGTVTPYNLLTEFTAVQAGHYEKLLTVDEAGEWNWDVVTTGTAAGAAESQFHVKAAEF